MQAITIYVFSCTWASSEQRDHGSASRIQTVTVAKWVLFRIDNRKLSGSQTRGLPRRGEGALLSRVLGNVPTSDRERLLMVTIVAFGS